MSPTRFGFCLIHLQGFLYCCLQHIKLTQAPVDSKITTFTQNPHLIETAEFFTLSCTTFIQIFKWLQCLPGFHT